MSGAFEKLSIDSGIVRQTIVPYPLEHNGIIDHKNHIRIECARSMFHKCKPSQHFWAQAMSTSVYLINRLLTSPLENKTPKEVWTGKKPNVAPPPFEGGQHIKMPKGVVCPQKVVHPQIPI